MPTNIIHPNPNVQQAMRALSRTNTPKAIIRAQAPFEAYVPDLDPNLLGAAACWGMDGLVPGARLGLGEVLKQAPGFSEIAGYTAGTVHGTHANTTNDLILLGWFPRTDANGDQTGEWVPHGMAVSAGNGAAAGSAQLYRLRPSTALWQEVAASGTVNTVAILGTYPDNSGNTYLYDWAVMPNGASPRTNLMGTDPGGPDANSILEPCFVFTNLLDPTMVYPVDPDGAGGPGTSQDGDYENLTLAFGNGSNGFRARSVEAWADRLNFLNTIENGVHHRRRLRRTHIGTADPDPAAGAGAGVIDFLDFSEDGLRAETLGNLLACYFGDGIAVLRRSGNTAAPYERQIITTKRGLLSTHSVANLGRGTHFGIFTDGFYFFDSSGQFSEAGVATVGGKIITKWTKTFFERLDMDYRERIFLWYDHINRWVWMSLPLDGSGQNEECWVYDPVNDRVFPQKFPATVFCSFNVQLDVGYIIDGAAPDLTDISSDGTIGGIPGTIGSLGPRYGVKALVHGTHNGLVMVHDPSLLTQVDIGSRVGMPIQYDYQTALSSGGSPRTIKTADRLIMEYIKSTGTDPTFRVFGNAGTQEQYVVSLAPGNAGDVRVVSQHFRLSSPQLGFQISGAGPIYIRSLELDAYDYGVEERAA